MRSCRAVFGVVLVLAAVACAQDEPRVLTAREIIARWRDAAESHREPKPHTARFKSVIRDGSRKIKLTEWVTSTGGYRRVAKRKGGRLEVVLLREGGTLRDWDGTVRPLAGSELECWRAKALETRTLAFGPSTAIGSGGAELGEDKRSYVLRGAAPGGAPMTWYVDTQTFLPLRAVIEGCGDTEYSDWHEKNLVFTAFRARTHEPGKPDYEIERKDARMENGARRFHPPQSPR